MVLDTSLINTQHYKIQIKGKWSNPRKRVAPSSTPSIVGGHVGDVFDVWPNELVQLVQVGGKGGPVKEGYKVVALFLKPSLVIFGLVG